MVGMVGFHQVMWFVMLKSAKAFSILNTIFQLANYFEFNSNLNFKRFLLAHLNIGALHYIMKIYGSMNATNIYVYLNN
jgi:hypothetical protein